jgi:hypothetical protein
LVLKVLKGCLDYKDFKDYLVFQDYKAILDHKVLKVLKDL